MPCVLNYTKRFVAALILAILYIFTISFLLVLNYCILSILSKTKSSQCYKINWFAILLICENYKTRKKAILSAASNIFPNNTRWDKQTHKQTTLTFKVLRLPKAHFSEKV